MRKINHTTTLRMLQEQGYDEVTNRQAMSRLTGTYHNSLAKKLKLSSGYITLIISGVRKTPQVQKELADEWGVPVEELFPNDY